METATFKTPAGEQIKKALAFCEKGIAGAEMYTFLRLNESNLPEGRFFCAENGAGEIVSAVFMNGDITVTNQAGLPPYPGLRLLRYAGGLPQKYEAFSMDLRDALALYKTLGEGALSPDNEARYVYRARAMRDGFAAGFCIRADNDPAAFACITAQNGDTALIGDVFTRPAYRGRGCARRCVSACVRLALEQTKTPYVLCADQMTAFYESMGFVNDGQM